MLPVSSARLTSLLCFLLFAADYVSAEYKLNQCVACVKRGCGYCHRKGVSTAYSSHSCVCSPGAFEAGGLCTDSVLNRADLEYSSWYEFNEQNAGYYYNPFDDDFYDAVYQNQYHEEMAKEYEFRKKYFPRETAYRAKKTKSKVGCHYQKVTEMKATKIVGMTLVGLLILGILVYYFVEWRWSVREAQRDKEKAKALMSTYQKGGLEAVHPASKDFQHVSELGI